MKISKKMLAVLGMVLVLVVAAGVYFLVFLPSQATDPPQQAENKQIAAVNQLQELSSSAPDFYFRNSFPRFVQAQVAAEGKDSVERARSFLDTYQDLYLQNNPDLQLHVRTVSGENDNIVKFYQTYQGVEVYAGEIVVYLDGEQVIATIGGLLPTPVPVDTIPVISASEAEETAQKMIDGLDLTILGRTSLMLFDKSLFENVSPDPHLVWRVTFGRGITYRYFIDAHTGEVLYQYDLLEGYFDLDLQDANGSNSETTACYWDTTDNDDVATEGAFLVSYLGDLDAEMAYNFSYDVYNYFSQEHYRDSYDNNGGQIEVYVHANLGGGSGSWTAGSFDCDLIEFEDGCVTYDIFVHEFTHGIVSFSSQLQNNGEPRALNESLADTMAVSADSEDWTKAEDFRPPCDPDLRDFANARRTHYDQYEPSDGYEYDNMHIHNHVVYLIATAGKGAWANSFGVGITREEIGRMYYYVLTNLTSGSGFLDARNTALVYAAQNFNKYQICNIENSYAAAGIGPWSEDSTCDGEADFIGCDTDQWPDEIDNCPCGYQTNQNDFDNDGIGDVCDDDIDGDAKPNYMDNCPWIANNAQDDADGDGKGDLCDDEDFDGILDIHDNCPDDPNEEQNDKDEDGIGNPCDPDMDGDGVDEYDANGDPLDNCPFVANPDQANADGDWIGDACDDCPDVEDSDIGQAYTSGNPWGPFEPEPYQPDGDGDGIPDLCDADLAFQAAGDATEMHVKGGAGSFSFLSLRNCAPDQEGWYSPGLLTELVVSGMSDGMFLRLGNDMGVGVAKPVREGDEAHFSFAPIGGRSYFLSVGFSPDYSGEGLIPITFTQLCGVPKEEGPPAPLPTPTAVPEAGIPGCPAGALCTTETFPVYYCEYLGDGVYQWYEVLVTYLSDGTPTAETVISGPHTGPWQPGCPGADNDDDNTCGNGVCDQGENASTCPADCPRVCDPQADNQSTCEAGGGTWATDSRNLYCDCCPTYTSYETCVAHNESCSWDRITVTCSHK